MNEQQHLEYAKLLAIVRYTIAICKQEVEKSIGDGVIPASDEGSPWGRAFIEISSAIEKDLLGPAEPKGENP